MLTSTWSRSFGDDEMEYERFIRAPPIPNATFRNWPGVNVNGRAPSPGVPRRYVFTIGVSLTMLATRRSPRHFAVNGAAELAFGAGPEDPPGGEAGADGGGGCPARAGVGCPPGAGVGGVSAGGGAEASAPAEGGVGGDPPAGGTFPPGGADDPAAPPAGGDDPGGGDPLSGSTRPKRAAARRILKKYMASIANANATSSAIAKK